MIELLEKIHKLGKVYNDLKLENILVGDANSSPDSLHDIRLIDFGLVSDYIDPFGSHVPEKSEIREN
jgi:serine/threonine protein kinase